MARKREPVDLQEVYGPEAAEAFKQQVHRFFEHLEATGQMPAKPKQAEIV